MLVSIRLYAKRQKIGIIKIINVSEEVSYAHKAAFIW